MTQSLPLPLPGMTEVGRRDAAWDRVAFWTAVFIVLIFTQFWVMPLSGPDGDPNASSLIRGIYFPAYIATLVLGSFRLKEIFYIAVRTPLLWLILALVFVSMTWSVDPGVTARRAVALSFVTIAGVVLAARYDWPRLLEVLATAFAIVVLVSFFLGLFVPSYGRMTTLFPGAWRGAWFEKNGLGDNMTMACLTFGAAAMLNPKQWGRWFVMATLALGLVLLSRSKTSLVSLVLAAAALGFVAVVKRGPITAVIATFLGVTGAAAVGFILSFASDAFFALLGKDATLTGRTKLWDAVMAQIQIRPITGFGYAAVWDDTSIWGPLAWISKQAKFVAVHSHNSWLELWLGLGLIGLVLFAVYFAEVWIRTIVSVYRSPAGYFALPFLTVYSAMTLTESVAVVYNDGFIWLLFVVLAAKLAAPSRLSGPALADARLAAPFP